MKILKLQQLFIYLVPYKASILIGTLSLLIVNSLGVYIPLLIRDNVDSLRYSFNIYQVFKTAILIFVLASIAWIIRMLSRLLIFGVGRDVEFSLKQKIFQHLLTLEPEYFSTHTSGDFISRATSDVDNIRLLVGFALLSLINTIFVYTLTFPVMLSINILLSICAVIVYPLMLVIVKIFSKNLQKQQLAVQNQLSILSQLIQEDMSNISLIKIYAQENSEKREFNYRNYQLLQAKLKLAQIENFLFPLIEGLSYTSLLLLLSFGAYEIDRNNISIGDFIALIILVERLVFPTALLGFTITAYQRGEVSIDRVETIFNIRPKVNNIVNNKFLPISSVNGTIVAKNLSYTYPGKKDPTIRNINFTIKPGEIVAIVGPVGSGKTTLANALLRLLDIEAGKLFLDNHDFTEIYLKSLREIITYVPQDSFLFNTTILNNIRYGDPRKNIFEVIHTAKKSQIHQEILNFPQQYETLVGERGITLSGGQRQRAALARALLMDSPVLILDDALSSVDNKTATCILENLSNEKKKSVIFISHQLSAAAHADRIFVMNHGEIIQIGTHKTLVNMPGIYQTLWQQNQLIEIID
ncbi:MAG: ABC transporter ATP-binding protein [Candidatus Atelocyanobacterium thalassa]|uniref:ABC-type multidrug transport system, ATPase and permease component n=1 Tax=Candidatus Atelocyanobacterium thalassa isolate SIO64986 TaxID=1527444 RepID=A0A086CGQ6_9CHRO|nr:MAG: ABC-type multidrug transport system, ATPase and permease component [Candidatus Atelocyanobacterium thalassa isolate SIO64986]